MTDIPHAFIDTFPELDYNVCIYAIGDFPMKKSIKIVLPLVLALIALIAAGWFFLFYNPTVTANLFLNSARAMADRGRYNRAVQYYDSAWKLMPERTELPLELAETYIADGNYTKAEYTLVSAISAMPHDYELYTALCRTYVEQGKLLDAVQMLDRISSESVRDTISKQRPEAPVITPENGFYTEYIEVTAQSSENKVYLTTDGEYPSNDGDLYIEPLTLESGETTIIALAVNDDGLVSPAVVCGYTVSGVVEEVTLADSAVDAAVRQLLSLDAADPIMTDDLWTIAALELPETVTDLSDLPYFTGLRSLTVHDVSGLDFTVLRQVPGLQSLDLSGCIISSDGMEAIGSLTELRSLSLNSCAISDLTLLSGMTKLTGLSLSGNTIADIGVLSLMPDLEAVSLSNNPISSIAGLSACNKLQTLDISRCSVTSLGSLSEKEDLISLQADHNQITDLSPLENCTKLEKLTVTNNLIVDISVLTKLPSLAEFVADHNKISVIPDFDEGNCALSRFSANYNEIDDISGLSGIQSLNYVSLDYNKVKNIQPLTGNINLVQLDVWDNPISDAAEAVKPFEESSIIVNYNPKYEAPKE